MRIATRASQLAMWQARYVAAALVAAGACADVELVEVSTSGDRDKTTPLHSIGGKGVFVKEVQAALFDGRADLAVHSAKDLPALTPAGLTIAAVPERGEPRDVLVGARLADLAAGATVATGSVRRRAQLAALRPDLAFAELRGNIDTRLAKAADFDAIVMAAAALERLELQPPVVDVVSVDDMIPQVGQGSLAIECRSDDSTVIDALALVDHPASHRRLVAERSFLVELGGDCSLPAGAHATLNGDRVLMKGFLAAETLDRSHRLELEGTEPTTVGRQLAIDLRAMLKQ